MSDSASIGTKPANVCFPTQSEPVCLPCRPIQLAGLGSASCVHCLASEYHCLGLLIQSVHVRGDGVDETDISQLNDDRSCRWEESKGALSRSLQITSLLIDLEQ